MVLRKIQESGWVFCILENSLNGNSVHWIMFNSPLLSCLSRVQGLFHSLIKKYGVPSQSGFIHFCLYVTLRKQMSSQKHWFFIHRSSQEMLNCVLLALSFGIGFSVLQMVKCYREDKEVIISLHNISKIIQNTYVHRKLFLLLLVCESRTVKESYRTANQILPQV